MPSLELRIDQAFYRIDSPDQEVCARWLTGLLSTFPITPATYVFLRVWPFYIPNPRDPWNSPGVPDWEVNRQQIDCVSAASPAEAATQFAARLAAFAEELAKAENPESASEETPAHADS